MWDGTITETRRPVDFTSLDFFRIQDGVIAEHWETVDWIRVYQSFGLHPDQIEEDPGRKSLSHEHRDQTTSVSALRF